MRASSQTRESFVNLYVLGSSPLMLTATLVQALPTIRGGADHVIGYSNLPHWPSAFDDFIANDVITCHRHSCARPAHMHELPILAVYNYFQEHPFSLHWRMKGAGQSSTGY